jgi:shikimate kinase
MSPDETGARRHLVLVGLMGAGKSSVGARCAERLGRAFVDTDDLIVDQAGMPVDEIFRTGGEERFRELERRVIADVCVSPAPLVIASGGGAIVDVDNRRRLREVGVVVWLHAPTEVLVSRVGNDPGRPLLGGDPHGALARLGAARQDTYSQAADRIVETEGRDLGAVADAVLAAFEEVAGVAS